MNAIKCSKISNTEQALSDYPCSIAFVNPDRYEEVPPGIFDPIFEQDPSTLDRKRKSS